LASTGENAPGTILPKQNTNCLSLLT
jgi:hypothetical protein